MPYTLLTVNGWRQMRRLLSTLIAHRIGRAAALVACLSCMASVCGAQTNRVAVAVSAPMRNGFVDTTKEIQDSVKDVRGRLSHMKEFQVVENLAGADIVLTVVARGVGASTYGQRITYTEYYGNATLTSAPMVANTYWVSTIMEVGQYRKEFLGSFSPAPGWDVGGNWSVCAQQIAKNLKSWAVANAEQLKQRHKNAQP
jgi:hypothetical protein